MVPVEAAAILSHVQEAPAVSPQNEVPRERPEQKIDLSSIGAFQRTAPEYYDKLLHMIGESMIMELSRVERHRQERAKRALKDI